MALLTPNPHRDRFARALDLSVHVPAPMLRAAWRLAVKEQDKLLQRTLVARPDAPRDLVDAWASLTDQDLQSVYWARADITPARRAVALAGERRAKVLADTLTRSGYNPLVCAAAAEAFLAKPTKTLADVLIHMPLDRITPALAEAIVLTYDEPSDAATAHLLTQSLPDAIRNAVCMLGPARASALLDRLNGLSLALLVARYNGVDNAARLRVLERYTRACLKLIKPSVGTTQDLWLRQLVQAYRDMAVWTDDVEATVAVARTVCVGNDSWVAGALGVSTGQRLSITAAERFALAAGDESRTVATAAELAQADTVNVAQANYPDLVDLTRTSDPDLLTQVCDHLCDPDLQRPRHEVHDAFANVLENPHLRAGDLERMLTEILSWDTPVGRLGNVDVFTRFPDRSDIHQMWLDQYPNVVLAQHGWSPFGGVAAARDRIRRWEAESDNGFANSALIDVLKRAPLPSEALLVLPWRIITANLWENDGAARDNMARVNDLIATRLGDNPDAWEMFAHLSTQWTGTITDLVDTCTAATGVAA